LDENIIPESLLIELRKMGYSEEMIRELCKWCDSSEHKGVASF
jgi:hypothetical protein